MYKIIELLWKAIIFSEVAFVMCACCDFLKCLYKFIEFLNLHYISFKSSSYTKFVR